MSLASNLLLSAQVMDLSGLWRFQLDPMGFGKTPGSELYLSKLTETITLPGSTDEAGKGIRNAVSHVDRLSRKFEYCGQAWYQREVVIPQSWQDKEILLTLERTHWETTVYVDGQPAGQDERLSTPNRFVLTDRLTPGQHTLTICVDNRLKYPMDQWTHGTTEYTQTNWNGITGCMELQARIPGYLEQTDVYPDCDAGQIRVCCTPAAAPKGLKGRLSLTVREKSGGRQVVTQSVDVPFDGKPVEQLLAMGRNFRLWDEFSPFLYELTAVMETPDGCDTVKVDFGMRKVEQGRNHIRLNGCDIHLRGTLECAVFPLTGYPSTQVADWTRIMRTVKDYGLNHVRFHSWCPPRAAFQAADAVGIYLQVELPMWIKDVGKYPDRRDFFEKELYAVLKEYGNHPSFLLMCNGNENEGDFAVLEDLVRKGQTFDGRHLYSASTARTHVAADQYYASHVTEKGWITVYEGRPSTDWDLNKESAIDVPVIAHETGQRCMYPDFGEMSKYTGVLEPRNFRLFQERLARNGMLHQADDFFRATGAHTVLQYKEVNEALLRTATSGGFQLLGLTDFPGQGSAFVGILDAFWESKGLVSPEKYRESCGPVVLLARLPRRVYQNTDTLSVRFDIYNFGPRELGRGNLQWSLTDEQGHALTDGRMSHTRIVRSTVDSLGTIVLPLSVVRQAGKYTLRAWIDGRNTYNEWDVWVYPPEQPSMEGICYARTWQQAKEGLEAGRNVLFIPAQAPGRKTHFAGHFWNPVMFNWDPMIVGTLIDCDHAAFSRFPTSYYADWQWWDVLNHATAVDLTDLRALTPVIQSIDTYEVNRKLGIAFEVAAGKGRLFVLCVDPEKEIAARPATRQLLFSVADYVRSDKFNPCTSLPLCDLEHVFDGQTRGEVTGTGSGEAVRQLLNQ